MRIKTKEKTVKTFTFKLTEKELKGLYSDLYDVLMLTAESVPDLYNFYDAVRVEAGRL